MSVAEIVDSLPEFLLYIVPGFVFISLLLYQTNYKQEYQNKIITSVVLSLVFYIVFDALNNLIVMCIGVIIRWEYGFHFGLILSSILFSFFIGRLVRTHMFKKILCRIGINRTINKNIWVDTISSDCWVRAYLFEEKIVILGLVNFIEETEGRPIITMNRYKTTRTGGELISNYYDRPELQIMIDTNHCSRIEIMPYKIIKDNASKYKDIISKCKDIILKKRS